MSDYNFEQAFNQAFQGTTSMPSVDNRALQAAGLKKTVPTTDLVVNGPTVTPSPGTAPAEESQGRRPWDHIGDYNFVVEIDGLTVGAFQKCDGLSFECDIIEYKDSMDPYVRYRPGVRRFGKLKLTKGYVGSTVLWNWCQSIIYGKNDRRHGAIHLYDDDGTSLLQTYLFQDAFPVRWSGFRLDGKGNSSLIEELELVVENVIRG